LRINRFLLRVLERTFLTKPLNKAKQEKFKSQFTKFVQLSEGCSRQFEIPWNARHPIYEDSTDHQFDRHYIYHTAWAARKLEQISPKIHVDIGSSLYFSGIISAHFPVIFYDYRAADLNLEGLKCGQADLTKLDFQDSSIESLSCMHVIEHIGLGRYGDALDPEGDLKAFSELKRVLANGGSLLLVVPVGKPVVEFNAQRIYSYDQIVGAFSGMQLQEFSLVPDDKKQGLILHADPRIVKRQSYGCGCFWFTKP